VATPPAMPAFHRAPDALTFTGAGDRFQKNLAALNSSTPWRPRAAPSRTRSGSPWPTTAPSAGQLGWTFFAVLESDTDELDRITAPPSSFSSASARPGSRCNSRPAMRGRAGRTLPICVPSWTHTNDDPATGDGRASGRTDCRLDRAACWRQVDAAPRNTRVGVDRDRCLGRVNVGRCDPKHKSHSPKQLLRPHF